MKPYLSAIVFGLISLQTLRADPASPITPGPSDLKLLQGILDLADKQAKELEGVKSANLTLSQELVTTQQTLDKTELSLSQYELKMVEVVKDRNEQAKAKDSALTERDQFEYNVKVEKAAHAVTSRALHRMKNYFGGIAAVLAIALVMHISIIPIQYRIYASLVAAVGAFTFIWNYF